VSRFGLQSGGPGQSPDHNSNFAGVSLMLPRRDFLSAAAGLASLAFVGPGSKSPIKIGQIGVGHAHASKLSAYRSSPDYEVVGIVEPDPLLRAKAQLSDPFKDLPWMTQQQLLNVPGLQAVMVETRVRDLLTVAEACVAAGKHVGIDKPPGESLPQLKRILDSAERQKLVVQMGYMYRYNPGIVLLRQFVERGWLGELFEVHTVMGKVVPPADRLKLAEYPGGIMFELGCHVLDTVVKLLGKPQSVSAFGRHVAPVDDSLQDNMVAVLAYEKAIATIKAHAAEIDGGERRHLVVCGTEGTFHIQTLDNPKARVTLSQARDAWKKGTQDIPLPRYTRYVDDAADMARIIRGEKPNDFSYAHDLVVQEALLKACGLN
jgi:predicted dehydrogenase